MSKKISIYMGLVMLTAQSCISYSTLQTARAVGDENLSITVAGSSVNSGWEFEEDKGYRVPMLELQGIYGWNDRLDVQAKIGLLGTSGLGFKYQFAGSQTSPMAAATGLFGGVLSSSDEVNRTFVTDLSVPLFVSWHPKNWLALYAVPRYTRRVIRDYEIIDAASKNEKLVDKSPYNFMGGTAGLRVGKSLGVMLEYSMYNQLPLSGSLNQFSIGLTYNGLRIKL